jgi:hypothetical protein
MKSFTFVLSNHGRRLRAGSVTLAVCALAVATSAAAQVPPPIEGLTGTVAPASTVAQEQAAANAVIVKTVDGAEHLLHLTTHLVGLSGKPRGVDALEGLRDGSTVVVHDAVAENDAPVLEVDQIDGEELTVTEGTVIRIDRRRQQILIRLDDGQDERLQLAGDSASVGSRNPAGHASDSTDTVTVYYADRAGSRVAHVFEKLS